MGVPSFFPLAGEEVPEGGDGRRGGARSGGRRRVAPRGSDAAQPQPLRDRQSLPRHDGIIHPCLAEGTLVSRADGTVVPIEEMQVGNRVLSYSRAGETEGLIVLEVDAVLDQGWRECVELLFSDGRTVVCTPDHRIRTADRRWVAAGDLEVGRAEVAVGVDCPDVTGAADGGTVSQPQDVAASFNAIINAELVHAKQRMHGGALPAPPSPSSPEFALSQQSNSSANCSTPPSPLSPRLLHSSPLSAAASPASTEDDTASATSPASPAKRPRADSEPIPTVAAADGERR